MSGREARGAAAFPTTHWSVVINLRADTGQRAQKAAETLCRVYWYPLYAFVRRQGRSHHEAEDCTQEFLARLIASAGMARARQDRGRFRTFLLTALRHFLTSEWRRARAGKRGGGRAVLALDVERAEGRFAHEPADPGLTPEQAFDRTWALELLDEATRTLHEDYAKGGREEVFAALVPILWESGARDSVASTAARLGMEADAVSVALHRLRRRFGERLRAIVAETVADPAEVDAELRHLIATVGLCGPAG